MTQSAYTLVLPKTRTTAAVFTSPHSGREYPSEFVRASVLDKTALRSSEDAFVDQLFASAPEFGAPLLTTPVPRAFVDLNRGAQELDPALIDGVPQNRRNPRISSGLGVIPRVVANGREIHNGKISMGEARRRLSAYYHPYHDRLRQLITESETLFGFSLLFDCHSMPHEALAVTSYADGKRPDIVLGDRFGATAAAEYVDETERAFQGAGLLVSRNLPFAGAFVTQNYGRPDQGKHAIQIEIDRSIYMNEATVQPNQNFAAFQQVMHEVTAQLAKLGQRRISLAAE